MISALPASITVTDSPAWAINAATNAPTGPAPTIATSLRISVSAFIPMVLPPSPTKLKDWQRRGPANPTRWRALHLSIRP
jgi:hypothetical protein